MEPLSAPMANVLTNEEQRIIKIARVGGSHETDCLVEIIERLTGLVVELEKETVPTPSGKRVFRNVKADQTV